MCLISRARQVGSLEALDAVDEHVGRALAALEAAGGQHERLRANGEPEAVVDRRRHDQVDRPVLVLEQHEGDALRGRRPLSRHDEPRDPHAPPVRMPLELLARPQVPRQIRPHQLERMLPQRDPRRPVVGQHPLPRGERPQLRPLVRIQRQRQLSPLRHRRPRHGNPERPQRLPPPLHLRPINERITGTGPSELPQSLGRSPRPPGKIAQRTPRTARLPLGDQRSHLTFLDAADIPQPESNC